MLWFSLRPWRPGRSKRRVSDPDGDLKGSMTTHKKSLPTRWVCRLVGLLWVFLLPISLAGQTSGQPTRAEASKEPLRPEWCRQLPRPGYKHLDRVSVNDPWFEVYRIRPGVFAIYEPHQYEEAISYLILGDHRALLFDTGLGIGNMKALVGQLTQLPITVLNSHSHFDHIGDDWQFPDIVGEDNPYTQTNSKGATHEQLVDVVAPERFCGKLPEGFRPESYAIPAFHINHFVKDGDVIDLGGRKLDVLA